ncbi:MAG: WD40 repeat domain-containing protein [Anaerolineae bacterium]|nr:WD40 repeat domain-containing protein [Anaerolineae bacterium]
MRLRLLRWITLVGLLGFVGIVNAQDNVTPTASSTPPEALLIPLVQNDPNLKGSSVFWSPDSHYIVASNPAFSSTEASFAGTQYGVFDVRSGQFLFSFTGFVDWMPDSQHILMRDQDGTDVHLRDVPSGKVIMTLQGAQIGWKWNVDRTQAASQSADNSLHIYDLASGTILQTWRNVLVKDALWSNDSRLIAVSGVDTMLRVYDVTTGSLKAQLVGYQPLGWKSDNQQLIVTPQQRNYPDKLGLWTLESGATAIFDVLNTSYVWSPDGKQLAIAGTDKSIHLVDTNTGKVAQKIEGFESRVSLFQWNKPEQLIVITGDLAAAIPLAYEVFDVQTGTRLLKAEFDIFASARVVDNHLEIIQSCQKICKQLYDLTSGEELPQMDFQISLASMLYVSPDFQWILDPDFPNRPGATEQTYHLYNVQSPTEVATIPGYKDYILYTSWSPDSHYFAVIAENSVRIWAV